MIMTRANTTSDTFNAVVAALGFEQPSVSKHLRVLRDVGWFGCVAKAAKTLPNECRDDTAARMGGYLRALLAGSIKSSEGACGSDRPPDSTALNFS